MSVRSISIRTDASGAYTYTRAFKGVIHGIEVLVGDLSTPDVDITDDDYSLTFLSVNGVAADTIYFPSEFLQDNAGTDVEVTTSTKAATAAICMGTLKVAVTGGGDTKRGRINILYS